MTRHLSEHFISHHNCVIQALIITLHGNTTHTILVIMLYDEYVAICKPLRYSAIMTNRIVVKLSAVWGSATILVGVLMSLTSRLNCCRMLIKYVFCDIALLFELSCDSVLINNDYGLNYTGGLEVCVIGSIIFAYTKSLLKICKLLSIFFVIDL